MIKAFFVRNCGFVMQALWVLSKAGQILKLFCFRLFAFCIFPLPLQSFWAEYVGAAQGIERKRLKLDQKGL
jgi:hypothetical protein